MISAITIKPGQILRNATTREMWLVVNKTQVGLFVVNLMVKHQNPALIHIILPYHMDIWERDQDIDDVEEWEKQILEKKMPMVEQIEGLLQHDTAE